MGEACIGFDVGALIPYMCSFILFVVPVMVATASSLETHIAGT
jgi:hypothetical protein